MFVIVDVYNRGGANSLGTVVKVLRKRPSLKKIEVFSTDYSGYPRSGGFVPCVGVQLKRRAHVGYVIQDSHCSEIFGTEWALKSIQNVDCVLTEFDLQELLVDSSQLNGFRPVRNVAFTYFDGLM